MPADRAGRFAACYECGTGEPGAPAYRLTDDPATSRYLGPPAMLSGGGGMVSTVDDYRRFADMLLGKGELDGVRVLGRKTVEYMTCNHLPGNRDLAAMGVPVFSETPFAGVGFGLGFSVALDPAAANVIDSPGQFAWGGLAGTYFWVDPLEELSVIFFAQLIHSDAIPASPPRVLRRRPQAPHLPGPDRLTALTATDRARCRDRTRFMQNFGVAMDYTAIVKRSGEWWIGWIEEYLVSTARSALTRSYEKPRRSPGIQSSRGSSRCR